MKKLLLISTIVLTLVSCKKVYQCECREVYNYSEWDAIITSVPIEESSKKDAETICNSLDVSSGNGNYKDCKLK